MRNLYGNFRLCRSLTLRNLLLAPLFYQLAEAVYPLPHHTLVSIYNGHESNFPSFMSTLQEHPGTVNFASLYSYTIGAINANWTLPKDADYRPFGYENFTLPLKTLTPTVFVAPVIQMGGSNAEINFNYAQLWTKEFVNESVFFNYDAFVLDCQISHSSSGRTQSMFANFLNVFAGGLHNVSKSLILIVRYDFPKDYVSSSAVDAVLGYDYSENPLSIIGYVSEIGHKYPRTAGVLFEAYPSWVEGNNTFDTKLFNAADLAGTHHLGLWTNLEGVVGKWWNSTSAWVANQSISMA
jgi:hypothetical protein